MRSTYYIIIIALGVYFCLNACNSDSCEKLNNQITDALEDSHITSEEYARLLSFITNPANELDKKCKYLIDSSGHPDKVALFTFIKKNSEYRKQKQKNNQPPIIDGTTDDDGITIRAKLYLESSRSMFPYDNEKGQGQFKKALTHLLFSFENTQPGQTKLAVVNDKIYDLNMSYTDFIGKSSLYSSGIQRGNSAFTDFNLIFRQILSQIQKGEIGILVSDLVYSPIDKNASPEKVMSMGQGLMADAFSQVANTTSLLILQLSADYQGKYYSETTRNWVDAPDRRPYYICLIAENFTMQKFLADPAHQDILRLPGAKNFWFFEKVNQHSSPVYTVLLNDKTKKGNLKQHTDEVLSHTKAVHSLEEVKPEISSRLLTIPIAIDLSSFYLPESTINDLTQYEVAGPDGFRVTAVSAYSQNDGKPNGPLGTTHKLLLTSTTPAHNSRTATITLRRTFPPKWVINSHTHDDSQPDSSTTFGLQNLLQGIEQAYKPTQQSSYFKLIITLAP